MKSTWVSLSLSVVLSACGGGGPAASARAVGVVELSSFAPPLPTGVEARADDGEVRVAPLQSGGGFSLALSADKAWSFRVIFEGGAGHPLAIPRTGHFDRAIVSGGRVDANFGTIWLPPPTADVTRVNEQDGASCAGGRLEDGTPCTVMEALVSCADGPARPVDDPTTLLLGTGALADLPGADRGTRYVVPSRAPPPILWECPALQPY